MPVRRQQHGAKRTRSQRVSSNFSGRSGAGGFISNEHEKTGDLSEAEFGQLLRGLRRHAGLTQAQIAEASGLAIDTIRKLESGVRRAPYHETAAALADALKLPAAERDHFIAVAKRARAHGPAPVASEEPRGRRRSWIGVTAAIAALVTILGVVAAARFATSSDSPDRVPADLQPSVHITKASECTGQWSLVVANNTAGTVALASGTGSFEGVSADRKAIAVSPGQSLDGKVALLVHNGGAPFAIAPLIYTPSWGVPEKSWQLIARSVPDGTTLYSPEIHLPAPATRGLYHLIFAFQLEMNGAQVASGTSWVIGHNDWKDGNEIAGFNAEQIREAQTFGCTSVRWLTKYGYEPFSVPADAITINVR